MRLIPVLTLLALSACSAPQTTGPVAPTRKPLSASAAPTGTARGTLIGLTAAELARALGMPKQEAYELDARRLQWANGRCVLDAYLSASVKGERRATYLDARSPSGEAVDAEACAATLRLR